MFTEHAQLDVALGGGADDFDGRAAVIPLPEIKCNLAMADVYDGVSIESTG